MGCVNYENLLEEKMFTEFDLPGEVFSYIKQYPPEDREMYRSQYMYLFTILDNNKVLRKIATQKDRKTQEYRLVRALKFRDVSLLNKDLERLAVLPGILHNPKYKQKIKDLFECNPQSSWPLFVKN